jgi:uncharacterized protein YneF (UPF0154 family)
MTDRRVTQVAPLAGGTKLSERRVSQVAPLAGGTKLSERRVSQVVVLVLGRLDDIEIDGMGLLD